MFLYKALAREGLQSGKIHSYSRYANTYFSYTTMSYSVKVVCTVMCLFHHLCANPLSTKACRPLEETIKYLESMVKNCKVKVDCIATMVPTFYDEEENVTVAEVSCKAVKSLETTNDTKRVFVKNLNNTLVNYFSKDVECTIDDTEQKDLYTALEELLKFFRQSFRHSSHNCTMRKGTESV